MKSIDIIAPAYNEQQCLPLFYERLTRVIDELPYRFRILIIDDGSRDRTPEICAALSARDPRVGYLRLSRNFGHQAALTAGLDRADADAAIAMDADLQNPPEVLTRFIEAWEQGAEVVSGVRNGQSRIGWFKRAGSSLFYRFINAISAVPITANSADFRLFDRRVIEATRALREQGRFLRGIYAWVGFREHTVLYRHDPRAAGRSKYGIAQMWRLARAAILSFSRVPLRLASYLGLAISGVSLACGITAAVRYAWSGSTQSGWVWLATLMAFLSGLQLLVLGIVGEYLGQVLDETRQRPLYVVAESRLPGPSVVALPASDVDRALQRRPAISMK
ncbi:MAG: glycosyltransferase family 2 protein [Proteobacteria bacterium]|nr:glycosyltransferase family 2 protein [Pseudomonadota bacterium]